MTTVSGHVLVGDEALTEHHAAMLGPLGTCALSLQTLRKHAVWRKLIVTLSFTQTVPQLPHL